MKGPTMRRRADGNARRTVSPPRSTVRGTIAMSMASQLNASPRIGSLAGKKLMMDSLDDFARPYYCGRTRETGIWDGTILPQVLPHNGNRRARPRVAHACHKIKQRWRLQIKQRWRLR